MDDFVKYVALLSLPIAFTALLYNAARASEDEAARVKAWATEAVFILLACAGLAWFAYQCILFAKSTDPLSRSEIINFALNVVNVVMYGGVIKMPITARLTQKTRAKVDKHKREIESIKEEIIIARENILAKRISAQVSEQLADFASRLTGSQQP